MSHQPPNAPQRRTYTHFLPKESASANNTTSTTSPRSILTNSSSGAGRYSHISPAPSDTPIEHYLERLNRNYRQITSSSSILDGEDTNMTHQRSKHAYDLYNNDDFYLRKYGDFLLTEGGGKKTITTTTTRRRISQSPPPLSTDEPTNVNNYCDLHGPTHNNRSQYNSSPYYSTYSSTSPYNQHRRDRVSSFNCFNIT